MNETAEQPAAAAGPRRIAVRAVGSLAALGVAAGAVALAPAGPAAGATAESVAHGRPVAGLGGPGGGWGWGGFGGPGSGPYGSGPYGADPYGSAPYGTDPYGSGAGTAAAPAGTATAAQEAGVVDIDTVQKYRGAAAAGTGMILTSDGEILTNNHVVDGATSITVTVVSTGATYAATVVGTDPTADVAVLHLAHASGLQTVRIGGAGKAGEAVTAVGNAGGTGGTPSAAPGRVVALDRSITASDEGGGGAEQLSGLIQTDADVQAGDSGGPLLDAAGAVIGMDTAASSGPAVQGYAIPIATAESIAAQIEHGVDSATVHQGYPAFLGIEVQDGAAGGAAVGGVLSGGPADAAGLAAGDTITSLGGTAIGTAGDLTGALAAHSPGQRVTLTWTDVSGTARSAQVTLAAGPAD